MSLAVVSAIEPGQNTGIRFVTANVFPYHRSMGYKQMCLSAHSLQKQELQQMIKVTGTFRPGACLCKTEH